MSDTTVTNLPSTASESEMVAGSYFAMDVGSTETKKLPAQLVAKKSEGNSNIHALPFKYSGYLALDDGITIGKLPIDNLLNSIAPVFDTTADYKAGQSVMYQGKLYTFKVNHPAGAWSAGDASLSDSVLTAKLIATTAMKNSISLDNLVKDIFFEKVVESWGESTGWYYNWVAFTRSFSRSFDILFNGMPTLKCSIAASGQTAWCGSKEGYIDGDGKKLRVRFSYYVEDATDLSLLQVQWGNQAWTATAADKTVGWHHIEKDLNLQASMSPANYRYIIGGTAVVYFSPLYAESPLNDISGLTTPEEVNQLKNKLYPALDEELYMPARFHILQNHDYSIFHENFFKTKKLEDVVNLRYDVSRSSGNQMKDRLDLDTATAHSYTDRFAVSFTSRDYFDNAYLQKNVVMHIHPATAGSGLSKKVLIIGDSLTQFGVFIAELVNLFSGDAMSATFVGTRTSSATDSTGVSRSVNHEGRGGWTAKDYCTVASKNGVTNAFFNPITQKFDYSYYLANSGVDTPDMVLVLLGTNDSGNTADVVMPYINEIVASITSHASTPKCGVGQCVPVYKWAFADYQYSFFENKFEIRKAIGNTYGYDVTQQTFAIPLFVNFDSVNDFGSIVAADRLNDESRRVVTDPVHPNDRGYFRMADTLFANIKAAYES